MNDKENGPTVSQLLVGYVREEETPDGRRYKASGSVSLIKSGENIILVDCGDPWNGAELINALQTEGCKPEDITLLVITHGHSDHCGNMALFKNSTVIMDEDLALNGYYRKMEESDWKIDRSVEILKTPGHTKHDLSVIVRNTKLGTVVIAGDAFESAEDLKDESVWAANSVDVEEQRKSRHRLLDLADYIIPGHGPGFPSKDHL